MHDIIEEQKADCMEQVMADMEDVKKQRRFYWKEVEHRVYFIIFFLVLLCLNISNFFVAFISFFNMVCFIATFIIINSILTISLSALWISLKKYHIS